MGRDEAETMYKNINFINLNEDEIRLVLSWRNNPTIKKWMYTKEDISLEDHLNFIKSLNNNSSKAEVFKENSTAIKLYKRFGFTTIEDNKTMLVMELNNREYQNILKQIK